MVKLYGRQPVIVTLAAGKDRKLCNERVTAVVTSCRRQDLLDIAIGSFFAANTYPHVDMIVVEDGPDSRNARLADKYHALPIRWIGTQRRVGQIRAIDFAYSQVTAPYIFHLEDDWEFNGGGFIEASLTLLRAYPKCLLVHVRAPDDINGHPLAAEVEFAEDVTFRRLATDHFEPAEDPRDPPFHWPGFSFNPGLRRLSDYRAIGTYESVALAQPGHAARAEQRLGEAYCDRGFFAAVLTTNGGRGYTRHLGDGRQVYPPLLDRIGRKLRKSLRSLTPLARPGRRSGES
jgi:hypothetical protein